MNDMINDSLIVTIYSPESQLRSPRRLLQQMFNDLISARELAWRLFVRDISAQYRQSAFGILWAIAPALVTSLIFIILQSRRIIQFDDPGVPYPLYVITGMFLWQIFIESLNAPLKSTSLARPILAKINFPYEALILSAIYNVLFSLLLKSMILVLVLLFYRPQLTSGIFLAPLAYFMIILLGIGIGLLLTPLGLLYTDVSSALPLVSQLWFYITPVVYPIPTGSTLFLLTIANPISPLLIAARNLTINGGIENLGSFVVMSAVSIILVFISWVVFRVSIPILIERISA